MDSISFGWEDVPGTRLAKVMPWLLRVNRSSSEEWMGQPLASFSKAFVGGSWRKPAPSVATLSRWETGVTTPQREAVRRYEELLRLRTGTLTGVMDGVHWMSGKAGSSAFPLGRLRRQRLIEANDLASMMGPVVNDEPMSAAQWEDLSVALNSAPAATVAINAWLKVTERLAHETVLSTDELWLSRYSSLTRLLSMRIGETAGAQVVEYMAHTQDAPMAAEHMGLLEAIQGPRAKRLILNELENPYSSETLYGATASLHRRIVSGMYSQSEIHHLGHLINAAFADDQAVLRDYGLLSKISPQEYSNPNQPKRLGRTVTSLTGRVAILAADAEHLNPLEDEVFNQLVAQCVSSESNDAKMLAAHCISASPYRGLLSRALCLELGSPNRWVTRVDAEELLYLFRFVGKEDSRLLLEQGLISKATPYFLRLMCARVLGHVEGRSATSFWQSALAQGLHEESLPKRDVLLGRILYSLGVEQQWPLLVKFAQNPAAPHRARLLARWWTGVPALHLLSVES